MHRRTLFASAAVGALFSLAPLAAMAADRLPVVASFSILGDMVSRVGADRVSVTTLVGAGGDAHVFQPRPADARAVAEAGLVVMNGLGFDGWLDRLISAAGYRGPVMVATDGIHPLSLDDEEEAHEHAEDEDHDHEAEETHAEAAHDHDAQEHDHAEAGHHHGDIDPHAFQSLANAKVYVANIEKGLIAADPAGRATYEANAGAYLDEITRVETEVRAAIEALPADRRTIVTSHDAFGYFADAYGLTILAPQGVSTDAEPSAADVARLITQIRQEHIPAIFVENITDPRLVERIGAETGARVGGTLYTDALSGPEGPAGSYLDMIRANLRALTEALGS